MSNCGSYQDIYPECDMTRWETSCSVPYYTKAEIDEIIEHLEPGGCCCPKFAVEGTTLVITDADDCVYVTGTTLVIGD